MASSVLVGAIFLLFGAVILNGFAAGVAAALYLRDPNQTRGSRIAWSVLISGIAFISLFTGVFLVDLADGPVVSMLALLVLGAMGTVVSLPGAIIMSRKIEAVSTVGRTFD